MGEKVDYFFPDSIQRLMNLQQTHDEAIAYPILTQYGYSAFSVESGVSGFIQKIVIGKGW